MGIGVGLENRLTCDGIASGWGWQCPQQILETGQYEDLVFTGDESKRVSTIIHTKLFEAQAQALPFQSVCASQCLFGPGELVVALAPKILLRHQ